ncbi:hypothetical protein [Flavobacterium foetidum]|uniref:hypothetical protein n=1 Tax=Flavobacterium foetidum TaxID=2026681 RepID=UPI0010754137|nr:hypothetical protein [Flavobacterium foetidum]KAF2514869.1 hypothetical protein E0W73_10560 [Flavobacterium foetidum]
MMKSRFNNDLSKEIMLGKYLDVIYHNLFEGFDVKRISDHEQQHKGIDLIITKNKEEFFIDEKAQLDYLEKDLPTFAFEISYLKDGTQRNGWLFDDNKATHKYFCITAIGCNEKSNPESGFKSCKITSIDRSLLINLLGSKGLTYERIIKINEEIRSGFSEGKIPIQKLNSDEEGYFYFSKSGKSEQPINVVLKLAYLIENKAGKRVY